MLLGCLQPGSVMVGCRKNVTMVLGHHGNSMCSPSGLVVKPSLGGKLKRERFDRLQVICYLFPFSEKVRRWDQQRGHHVNTICNFENNYYDAVLHIFSGRRRPQRVFLDLGVGSEELGRINGISCCRFFLLPDSAAAVAAAAAATGGKVGEKHLELAELAGVQLPAFLGDERDTMRD